jgi:hypothetical protein
MHSRVLHASAAGVRPINCIANSGDAESGPCSPRKKIPRYRNTYTKFAAMLLAQWSTDRSYEQGTGRTDGHRNARRSRSVDEGCFSSVTFLKLGVAPKPTGDDAK